MTGKIQGIWILIPILLGSSVTFAQESDQIRTKNEFASNSNSHLTAAARLLSSDAPDRAEFLQFLVEGVVTDAETGEPLAGVNVVVSGTTVGTSTGSDGSYSIRVPEDAEQVLEFSFVGFESRRISIDGRNEINVQMQPSVQLMDEAVVTAIGLERERRTIGYSISQVNQEDLMQGTEANLANLLQGQAAGVHISPVGGGPGASSDVKIRGASSISGDNQPLYVVDGIPIDNSNIGSAGKFGGFDGGDGIQSINPADIESISVLKGASAAALYGERARDGVILIETQQGQAGDLRVNFSSNITMERLRITHDEVQTQYGQGSEGQRPQGVQEAWESNMSSWGEPYDGAPTIQWDGVQRPYRDLGSPLNKFYRTGVNARNSISLSGGVPMARFYISASNLESQSIMPNSDLSKTSLTIRGNTDFGRLSADVKANYIDEYTRNRQTISGTSGNANRVVQVARNVPISSFEDNYETEEGLENPIVFGSIFTTNPYWMVNNFSNWDDRDRLIGHMKLDFEITDWLVATGRTGLDWYTMRRQNVTPYGTAYDVGGSMSENEYRIREFNTELFLDAYYEPTPSITIDGLLGSAIRNRKSETLGSSGSDFSVPGFHTLGNLEFTNSVYGLSEKEVRSLFGSAKIGYNDFLFLELTGRNDWSSTLPEDNNSFFYPSASVSFLFSDAFDSQMPEWLSYGQLRGSWAEVGSDTDPYMLNLTYNIWNLTHQGQPMAYISQGSIPLADLKPTITDEWEFGFDIRFFDDRLGIDFTWYDRKTTNQILSTDVPHSTGFTGRVINAGQIDNTGIEIKLTTRPISKQDLFWTSTVNFARNKNMVVKLVEGQELLTFAQNRTETNWITAQAGHEYGTLRGFKFARDDDGNIIHENGLPMQGELTILGRGTPDFSASWTNTVSWKNLTFSSMIDMEWGGQFYSGTNARLYQNGMHSETLAGRAQCDQNRRPDGRWQPDCFVGEGVDVNGGANTTGVLPSSYYSRIGGQIAEPFVYDKNLILLRQAQISYNLPTDLIDVVGLRQASVALVGRNLFFLYNPIPNIDPESSYQRGPAQGQEHFGIPNTRSIGVNVNLQF